MIKAKNRNYYVSETEIKKVWKDKDKYYASDYCFQKYEIEESDYIALGGKL